MGDSFNTRLIGYLSAGESRSGESIAAELGCSRTAVWKHIGELRDLGVEVLAVAGQGYRLAEPLELLNRRRIRQGISREAREALSELRLLESVDSTNAEIQRSEAFDRHGLAVLAERQTVGRGRRGRRWFSPYARNVYLSLGWRFETGVAELACLPLVVAIASCRALNESGVRDCLVKWPNDLMLGDLMLGWRKLGGCLVEVEGDAGGPCVAVMGVGINVRMPSPEVADRAIDQPWTDIASRHPQVSRNDLAARLIDSLAGSVATFSDSGFDAFRDEWAAHDGLTGREVSVLSNDREHEGKACGISERGGLLLRTRQGTREFLSGEVSIRLPG